MKESYAQRVREIEDACWANEPSVHYLTGDPVLNRALNRQRKRDGLDPIRYKPNFRQEVAVTRVYKEKRSPKPFHYYNLRAWVLHNYPTVVSNNMEADDNLAMDQDKEGLTTVICTQDKDLKQVPGLFYQWELGNRAAEGPYPIDKLGHLELPRPNKLIGTGLKFFYAQVIMGDPVDTIPGLPRGGPALAYKSLNHCETEEELYHEVCKLYKAKKGDGWETYLKEQMALLWMVRELDEEGNPVMYQPPKKD